MRTLTFRPLPDPGVFHTAASERLANPFKAKYSSTQQLLSDELDHLDATDAWLQVMLDGAGQINRDGSLSARARVTHPGIVVTVVTKAYGTLVYVCDRFAGRYSNDPPDWQTNLRAIALGLHDLRRLDRYGIADRGQQYAGFRELGAGTAMEGGTHDRVSLARFLHIAAHGDDGQVLDPDDHDAVEATYRAAAKRHHPDVGGSPQMMSYITAARDALLGS